jgi:glycosyltransferase involved in cell wall biosynthesis|tara:strand:+ start:1173 stop:1859 length:687 start_codon:yes stop_codon:yes gene_type:complete
MSQKISVLLSVHNDEKNIENAISSILNQTLEDLELLLMDDYSSDKSYDICQKYSNLDKRVRVFKNNKNIGLTKSLNLLANEARGEYIARQDSDDVSHKDRLLKQYMYLNNSKIDGCTTLAKIMGKNLVIPNYSRYIHPKIVIKYKNPFIHGTLMLKSKTFREVGKYDEKFYYAQDYKLFNDLIKNNFKITILKEALYTLNMNNNISTINQKEQAYFAKCVKKNLIPYV